MSTSDFPYGTKTTSTKSFISSQSGPTLSIMSENDQTYTETASIASVDAIAHKWQKRIEYGNKIVSMNMKGKTSHPQNPPRPSRQSMVIGQLPLIPTRTNVTKNHLLTFLQNLLLGDIIAGKGKTSQMLKVTWLTMKSLESAHLAKI